MNFPSKILSRTYCCVTTVDLFIEGFGGDGAAGDFFEEVKAHDGQEVGGVLTEQPFVVGYVFVVGFGNLFPEGDSLSVFVGCVNRFAVSFGHEFAQPLLFQLEGCVGMLRPQLGKVVAIFGFDAKRQVTGVFADGLGTVAGSLLDKVTEVPVKKLPLFFDAEGFYVVVHVGVS